jgi:hypothetical protein
MQREIGLKFLHNIPPTSRSSAKAATDWDDAKKVPISQTFIRRYTRYAAVHLTSYGTTRLANTSPRWNATMSFLLAPTILLHWLHYKGRGNCNIIPFDDARRRAIREVLIRGGSYDPNINYIETCINACPGAQDLNALARYELIKIIQNDIKAFHLSFANNMRKDGPLNYDTGDWDMDKKWIVAPALETPAITRFRMLDVDGKFSISFVQLSHY